MLGVLMELGVTGLPEDKFKEALTESFEGKQKAIKINEKVLEAAVKWARENL